MSNASFAPVSSLSPTESGATLRDVAERVGISVQSVSSVLNGGSAAPKRVSAKTREKIESAAEELGYRRNHAARSMRTGNSRMLGWLGGDLGEEHVGKMLDGALEAADADGYTLKILRLGHKGNAAHVIRLASELRLMGMLAMHLPIYAQVELHGEAQRYGYPLVLMDERSDETDIPQIISDDEGGIAQVVAHLAELGHRHIAFIGAGHNTGVIARKREEAFHAEMARHGLAVPAEWVAQGSFGDHEISLRAARQLLSHCHAPRPTAIVCAGDYIALSVLQIARELNLCVPNDLSVTGFANMKFSAFATPPLTTIEQPFTEIGRQAVHLLLNVIQNKTALNCEHSEGVASDAATSPINFQPLRLPTRLIQRASTAPPRAL